MDPNNEVFLLDNSGHGTGTLGILAGGPTGATLEVALGGAPEAEVLPVRISDRVVLLRTSALAAGLQYAADSRCDVITLSMGGLPSRLWGEVIDELSERGVALLLATTSGRVRHESWSIQRGTHGSSQFVALWLTADRTRTWMESSRAALVPPQ